MKTLRLSRNAEARIGRKTIVARGRASLSRSALLDANQTLTGRRFRRANRLTHEAAAMLDVFVRRADGKAVRPTLAIEADGDTLAVMDWRVIT